MGPAPLRGPGTGAYLGRVAQVERLVEAEVDEAQQGGVELGEGGHDPVVHVSWVLGAQEAGVPGEARTGTPSLWHSLWRERSHRGIGGSPQSEPRECWGS